MELNRINTSCYRPHHPNNNLIALVQMIFEDINVLAMGLHNDARSDLIDPSIQLISDRLQNLQEYACSDDQKESVAITLDLLKQLQEKASSKDSSTLDFFNRKVYHSWNCLMKSFQRLF